MTHAVPGLTDAVPAMTDAVPAWIGLGANLGDAQSTLDSALAAIGALPDTVLEQASSRYRSAPLQAEGPDFLNAVVRVRTRLAPLALLDALLALETAHGRQRSHRNAPRTLDLDLLLHGDTRTHSARLTLPHPRLHERAFVLAPMAELDPGLIVPGRGPIDALLAACHDQACVRLADRWGPAVVPR